MTSVQMATTSKRPPMVQQPELKAATNDKTQRADVVGGKLRISGVATSRKGESTRLAWKIDDKVYSIALRPGMTPQASFKAIQKKLGPKYDVRLLVVWEGGASDVVAAIVRKPAAPMALKAPIRVVAFAAA